MTLYVTLIVYYAFYMYIIMYCAGESLLPPTAVKREAGANGSGEGVLHWTGTII